jgi:hypothetical protein
LGFFIVEYNNHSINLLLVEAKARMSYEGSVKLEQEVHYLRHFIESPFGQDSLYYLLDKKIPSDILKSCGVQGVGVYATKQGGFRIHRVERLR